MVRMRAVKSVSRKTFGLFSIFISPFVSEKTAFKEDSRPWGPRYFFFNFYMGWIATWVYFEFAMMFIGSSIRKIITPLQLKLTQVAIKIGGVFEQ